MNAEIEKSVREWAALQSQLRQDRAAIAKLMERESALEKRVIEFARQNKLEKATLKLPDGQKIIFREVNKIEPLTHHLLKDALKEFNAAEAEKIYKFVCVQRKVQKHLKMQQKINVHK